MGDGAKRIAHQVEEQLDAHGRNLLAFYHLGECLGAAAHAIDAAAADAWLDTRETRLKSQRADEEIRTLEAYREPMTVADQQATIRRCYRYLRQGQNPLDYQTAIAQG